MGDTDLWVEIEKDFTVYGDELKFGGSKSIRDGMGQKSGMTNHEGALDFCLTNAIVLDYWGIVKADIGIKDGKIAGIGKAGNPDTMDAVSYTHLDVYKRQPRIREMLAGLLWRHRVTLQFMSLQSRKTLWKEQKMPKF